MIEIDRTQPSQTTRVQGLRLVTNTSPPTKPPKDDWWGFGNSKTGKVWKSGRGRSAFNWRRCHEATAVAKAAIWTKMQENTASIRSILQHQRSFSPQMCQFIQTASKSGHREVGCQDISTYIQIYQDQDFYKAGWPKSRVHKLWLTLGLWDPWHPTANLQT